MSKRILPYIAIGAVVAGGALIGLLTRAPRLDGGVVPSPRGAEPVAVAPDSDPAPRDFLGVLLTGQDVDVAPKVEGRVIAIAVKPGDRVRKSQVLATMDVRAARDSLHLAEANLADAKARLARRTGMAAGVLSQEEISNAEAMVLDRRARVGELRALVNDATVRAPFDGAVTTRFLDPGAMAGPARPILRIVGGNNVRVRFAIPEELTGSVATGMHARLSLKSEPQPLVAIVESVAPEVDAAARMTFAVARVELPREQAARLSAGMVARVQIIRDVNERATAR
jgi:RND family efflux transporter MFP subunit